MRNTEAQRESEREKVKRVKEHSLNNRCYHKSMHSIHEKTDKLSAGSNKGNKTPMPHIKVSGMRIVAHCTVLFFFYSGVA